MKNSSSEIRKKFIKFFEDRDHRFVRSAPAVPIGDQTLLFTNAGMNQFKDIFLGQGERDYKRAVNSQKCIRVSGKHNDLEEVGTDGYHHTFFEMLGNWSFGDYYKPEAIKWAWELLTQEYGLEKGKLYATVFRSDQEAYDIWANQTDIGKERILYFDEKDNFWEMGETGPCGPCSEIHIDLGEQACDKQNVPGHHCQVNGDCGRFVEIWNLVFIQYDRQTNGQLVELPQKHIDTGAGLERICRILQGVQSNYQTDLFMPIILEIERQLREQLSLDVKYCEGPQGKAFRVIADHVRMATFAIADSAVPSNEGRGYVVRRIIRRALKYGRQLGYQDLFMYRLVDKVVEILGEAYPEIVEKKFFIKKTLEAEEKSFSRTLDKGMQIFEEIVENLDSKIFPGESAFLLSDTYGFPLDLTQLMAQERGLIVDVSRFEEMLAEQKQRAKQSADLSKIKSTMGGEVEVDAKDQESKRAMARHHSATHLLHASLHKIIGKHATQSGSQVSPEKLRFDFKHFQALTAKEISEVEQEVNRQISNCLQCEIKEMAYDQAISEGAIALFGEKYADVVRRVSFGDFSMELCGGTHVENTADIKALVIISETAIAAGTRRIEAVAGEQAQKYLQQLANQKKLQAEELNNQIKQDHLNVQLLNLEIYLPKVITADQVQAVRNFFQNVDEQLENKFQEIKTALKDKQKQESKKLLARQSEFLAGKQVLGETELVVVELQNTEVKQIKELANSLVNSLKNAVVVIFNKDINNKTMAVIQTTKTNATGLIKVLTDITGGGGGGGKQFAQAGIKNADLLPRAIEQLRIAIKR